MCGRPTDTRSPHSGGGGATGLSKARHTDRVWGHGSGVVMVAVDDEADAEKLQTTLRRLIAASETLLSSPYA